MLKEEAEACYSESDKDVIVSLLAGQFMTKRTLIQGVALHHQLHHKSL